MPKYVVNYSIETYHETPWISAKSKKEAVQKVQEVIGADIKIESVIERREYAAQRNS